MPRRSTIISDERSEGGSGMRHPRSSHPGAIDRQFHPTFVARWAQMPTSRRLILGPLPMHRKPMMTFGFSTLLDLLSWMAAVMLGAKMLATLILLVVRKSVRDRPGWGAALWWSTKITPLIAVPCVIWIAWLQGMTDQVWIFAGLMAFVVVAVPWKIRRRRARMADRTNAGPNS